MLTRKQFSKFAFLIAVAVPGFAANPAPVVERGLPQANLNGAAGDYRSNVRWGWSHHGFLGDDFTIGLPGEKWVIDSIRTWAVPGGAGIDPAHLGDIYRDIRLYLGAVRTGLSPVATALLSEGSDATSVPSVRVSEAAGESYDDFGASVKVWQIDFTNLNTVVEGGVRYGFGVFGAGRPIPGDETQAYQWFNYASNAGLSAAQADGADNAMLLFDAGGKLERTFNAKGSGWDKSADINIQVFAHRVPSDVRATFHSAD